MDIILLEPIRIGHRKRELGEQLSVRDGYARNFLIPFGKAVMATKENQAYFEARRKELEANALAKLNDAKARAEKLSDVTLAIEANASEEGKLYGSVGTQEITSALKNQGFDIEKKEIILPEGPMHEVGEFQISIQLHADVSCDIKLNIVASK